MTRADGVELGADAWMAVCEAASFGFAVVDRRDRIVGANAVLASMLERTLGEVIGATLCEHVLEADRGLDHDHLRALRAGERASYELERRYRTRGDRTIIAREIVTLAPPGSAAELDRVVMLREVTESHRRATELCARGMLVLFGEAASVVSHEARNALAGIRSAVEVIGHALPPGGIEGVAVDEVRRRVGELDESVGELLRFARVPRLAPVSAHAVLAHVATRLADEGTSLAVHGPDLLLRADAPLLAGALLDLCRDAARAVGARPSVTVERERELVVLRVRPGAAQPVWTPSVTPRGVGLGLTMTRRVVEAHGGELVIDDAGGLTSALVRLPVGSDPYREARSIVSGSETT